MKRALLLPFVLLALSSTAAPPAGSTWKDVKVADITVYPAGGSAGKGFVMVTFSSNGMSTPGCSSGYPKNVVIDISTAAGAFAAAVLQSARLLGTTLTVAGTGTCEVSSGMETLAYVHE
jgi:hypothetical protein